MAQHVVVEPVAGKDIGLEVAVVIQPVVRQLLGTEHQHGAVAQLVILDHGQGREGFPQTDAVRQDAAAVRFELVDNPSGRILLKVEELVPNQGVLITRSVIGQHVFIDVIQERIEDVVEHQKIDALGRILLVHRRNVVANLGGHVLQLGRVAPDLVEQAEIGCRKGWLVHPVDQIGDGVALLIAQINGSEAVQRYIGRVRAAGLNAGKLLHRSLAAIGFEGRFAPHPVGALLGDGTLGQLVAKLNLKFTAVQASLTIKLGNVEFFAFLANLVGNLVGDKRWRGEDEIQIFNFFQFGLQRLERVHRKAGGRDLQAGTRLECLFQVVAEQAVNVVDKFHQKPYTAACSVIRYVFTQHMRQKHYLFDLI